jgi:hypothetical protein
MLGLRVIHNKRINEGTQAFFSYEDVTITQDGSLVVLEKSEILDLARIIQNEINDREFYKNARSRRK